MNEKQPHRHHHGRHHASTTYKRKRSPSPLPLPPRAIILPFKATNLSKHHLSEYMPMFASYLDIQKQLILEDLPEQEVKGRWKSFIGKWNRGELAEGWYDPATKQKANETARESRASPIYDIEPLDRDERGDEEDDSYGPVLPRPAASTGAAGPSAPGFQDLALRAELESEDAATQRSAIQEARRLDRREQKARLEEMAPRAEPGTKERQLEKKRESAAVARTFREAKGGAGELEEVGEQELIGGSGGLEDVKRMKGERERKKNEREMRREEILRARAVEREERLQVHREKEGKTMEMLKAIAKERFG